MEEFRGKTLNPKREALRSSRESRECCNARSVLTSWATRHLSIWFRSIDFMRSFVSFKLSDQSICSTSECMEKNLTRFLVLLDLGNDRKPRCLVPWLSIYVLVDIAILKKGFYLYTLQGINISHLGKRKIIFKMPFLGDMLVPWRVYIFI